MKTIVPPTQKIVLALILIAGFHSVAAAKKNFPTWTDPALAAQEDPDFLIQGEYGKADSPSAYGVQVVALGGGKFDAYVLQGGLPGVGWVPGQSHVLLKGERKDGKVEFSDAESGLAALFQNGRMLLYPPGLSEPHELPRVDRKSPTLGAKPPEGAVVLFDGTSADAWKNGKMRDGLLMATGLTSKQQFKNYKFHLEFRTPYMPEARGQQRGNSGVYYGGRWETQILDSFGLEGKGNEAGAIYSVAKPALNMCLPPLSWQTYDVEFTAAQFDSEGNRTAWPRITVWLNGVLVHEDLELPKDFTAAAPTKSPLESPEGPIFLQDHTNPVVFRNIWVLPRDE